MSDTRERAGAAGVVVAGTFFKIVLYICVIVYLLTFPGHLYQYLLPVLYRFSASFYTKQAPHPDTHSLPGVCAALRILFPSALQLQTDYFIIRMNDEDEEPYPFKLYRGDDKEKMKDTAVPDWDYYTPSGLQRKPDEIGRAHV